MVGASVGHNGYTASESVVTLAVAALASAPRAQMTKGPAPQRAECARIQSQTPDYLNNTTTLHIKKPNFFSPTDDPHYSHYSYYSQAH